MEDHNKWKSSRTVQKESKLLCGLQKAIAEFSEILTDPDFDLTKNESEQIKSVQVKTNRVIDRINDARYNRKVQ